MNARTAEAILAQLCDQLDAAPIQHIGKLLILWRPCQRKTVDEHKMAAPCTVKLIKYAKKGGQRPQVKLVKVLGNERITRGGNIKRAKARVVSAKKRAAD